MSNSTNDSSRVLIISPVDPDLAGRIGGTVGFIRTIREFMPGSWRITTPAKLLTANPFSAAPLSARRPPGLPERLTVLCQSVLALRRVARMQPAIVYCHSPEIACAMVLRRSSTRRVKVVLHQHGATNPIEVSRFPLARRAGIVAAYEYGLRAVHRALDGVVVIDDACEELNVRWGVTAPRLRLRNAVDSGRFKPDASLRWSTRAELDLGERDVVIVVAARLEAVKRIDLLLRAMPAVAKALPRKVVLMIAGDGGERASLTHLASESGLSDTIRFLGSVDWKNMPGILNAADVCALTSSREGVPMVLLEALSCGVPVVATRVGGVSEVVPEGSGALLDPDPTVQQVADALIGVAASKWSRTELSQSVAQYGAESAVARLEDFFSVLISGANRSGAAHA